MKEIIEKQSQVVPSNIYFSVLYKATFLYLTNLGIRINTTKHEVAERETNTSYLTLSLPLPCSHGQSILNNDKVQYIIVSLAKEHFKTLLLEVISVYASFAHKKCDTKFKMVRFNIEIVRDQHQVICQLS